MELALNLIAGKRSHHRICFTGIASYGYGYLTSHCLDEEILSMSNDLTQRPRPIFLIPSGLFFLEQVAYFLSAGIHQGDCPFSQIRKIIPCAIRLYSGLCHQGRTHEYIAA